MAAAAGPTTSIHNLTNDLLELVLLGLDSPLYLVRAASSCKRWRLIVGGTDGAFLRRFRSLHPPAVIGTYYSINQHDNPPSYGYSHNWPEVDPVFVPSSAYASDGLQLSLDFVPPPADGPRELVDGRGSLLLLLREKERPERRSCMCCIHYADYMTPDLVVCQPLTKKYQEIPPPDDRVCIIGAFLLDGDADQASSGAIGMRNFGVLLVQYDHDEEHGLHTGHGYPTATVFTSGTRWHGVHQDNDGGVYLPRLEEVHLAGRTGGRIYWSCEDKQIMVLDESTLRFSTLVISEHMKNWEEFGRNNLRIVSARHGTVVRIVHLTADGELEVFSQTHGTETWVLDMRVQILEACGELPGYEDMYFDRGTEIIDAEVGFVVLSPVKKTWLFSVDLETMELKREYRRKEYTGPAFPYMRPWAPVM